MKLWNLNDKSRNLEQLKNTLRKKMARTAALGVFFILLLWIIVLFYSFEKSAARNSVLIAKLSSWVSIPCLLFCPIFIFFVNLSIGFFSKRRGKKIGAAALPPQFSSFKSFIWLILFRSFEFLEVQERKKSNAS